MASLSDFSENLLLDWMMTAGAATRPTAWHLALFTAAPTDAGGGTEVSTGGYARAAIAFGAASGGTTSNTGAITFTATGASWGSITHIGIFDASTAGNLLWHGAMTTARTIGDGDSLEFAIGAVDLTLA